RRLKGRAVPLHIPVGEEHAFQGFVDLVTMKATLYADGKPREADVPADVADRVREYREKLVEAVAENDDETLSKYPEAGALGGREKPGAAREGDPAGTVSPPLVPAPSNSLGGR